VTKVAYGGVRYNRRPATLRLRSRSLTLHTVARQPHTPPLLGSDDPAPFVVLQEQGAAPVLIVCDHASRAFPASLARLGLAELAAWQHVAWDIGAAELARGVAAALDAPAVLAGYSRLVVDCNRDPHTPDAFCTQSDGWTVPGNRDLDDAQRSARLSCIFDPYHECIAALLEGFRARGIVPLLVSLHTFTPAFAGQLRPWHVGVLWDKDESSARAMLAALRTIEDLVVGDNEPYSGRHPAGFTVDQHAERLGLPHVSLEVRQDQFESAAGTERWVRIVASALRGLLNDPTLHCRRG
jgi:predicted N-formylglutamate amidohydrolase